MNQKLADLLASLPADLVVGGDLSLADAIAEGNDAAVAEGLNAIASKVQVSRGVILSVEFIRDLTPAMLDQMTPSETAFVTLAVEAGSLDLDGPALADILTRVGYPLTRPGTLAESIGLAPVTHAEVGLALRIPVGHQEKVVTEPDGSKVLQVFKDGVLDSAEPMPADMRPSKAVIG